MLNKLLPKQVATLWDIIKEGLSKSLPPEISNSPANLNKLLIGLLAGKLQCWMLTTRGPEGMVDTKLHGFAVTKIEQDEITEQKNLLIFSLYMYVGTTDEMWSEALSKILEFARANNCKKITAYTQNGRIKELAEKFAFDSTWTVITKDL